jgi:hypothetical protein
MLRKITLAFIAALLAIAFHPLSVYAYTQSISISVGRDGFNHTANYLVDVEAGQEVTITFTYADGDLPSDNPHQIRIVGLGLDLPTIALSRDNPTASITFTPMQTGTLSIFCIIPCIGMENLTGGKINVVAPKGSGAQGFLALELTLGEDGSVLARATLQDSKGNPVAGQPIIFNQQTSVGSELELGTLVTGDDGSALVSIPAVAGQDLEVTAESEGGNGIGFTRVAANLTVPGVPDAHPVGALSSATPPPILALILLIVLGGVWATYGAVVYQVFRIRE